MAWSAAASWSSTTASWVCQPWARSGGADGSSRAWRRACWRAARASRSMPRSWRAESIWLRMAAWSTQPPDKLTVARQANTATTAIQARGRIRPRSPQNHSQKGTPSGVLRVTNESLLAGLHGTSSDRIWMVFMGNPHRGPAGARHRRVCGPCGLRLVVGGMGKSSIPAETADARGFWWSAGRLRAGVVVTSKNAFGTSLRWARNHVFAVLERWV